MGWKGFSLGQNTTSASSICQFESVKILIEEFSFAFHRDEGSDVTAANRARVLGFHEGGPALHADTQVPAWHDHRVLDII